MSNDLYRVAAVQFQLRPIQRFEDFAEQATGYVATAKSEFDARCVVLPEYCTGGLMSIPTRDGKAEPAAASPLVEGAER